MPSDHKAFMSAGCLFSCFVHAQRDRDADRARFKCPARHVHRARVRRGQRSGVRRVAAAPCDRCVKRSCRVCQLCATPRCCFQTKAFFLTCFETFQSFPPLSFVVNQTTPACFTRTLSHTASVWPPHFAAPTIDIAALDTLWVRGSSVQLRYAASHAVVHSNITVSLHKNGAPIETVETGALNTHPTCVVSHELGVTVTS